MTNASPAVSQASTSEGTAAWSAVFEMEGPVEAARDYVNVVLRLDEETFKDADCACVVQRIGEELREHIDKIRDLYGILFRLLHPRRAEFEKSGWPGDEAAEAVD
jgi:hypothetical protein